MPLSATLHVRHDISTTRRVLACARAQSAFGRPEFETGRLPIRSKSLKRSIDRAGPVVRFNLCFNFGSRPNPPMAHIHTHALFVER